MSQYAKLGTRLACHLGDVAIIQIIILPLFSLLKHLKLNPDYALLTMLIWGIYSTIMNASSGRGTYGKKLMGVKIEKENGEKLNLIESAIRYILGFLLFGIVIGMIPILFTKKKKGFHDLIVGSVVKYRKMRNVVFQLK